MTYSVNSGQINAATKGNSALREQLGGIHRALQQLYQQTGSAPLQKVDATANKFSAPPAPPQLLVTGANGAFAITITLPQQAGGSSTPQNASNSQIYQEVSSSTVGNFASGVVTQPITTATSLVVANPGATLFWRVRSSYDQTTWSAYVTQPGSVAAGLQTSNATQPNLSLNQSNFATIDSVGAGGTATIRIYGSGGPGSSWTNIIGTASKVVPGGTIAGISYGSTPFVAFDGTKYRVVPSLTQTFPDTWIPVGRVSVIANGAGLVLPTLKAVVSSGSLVAIQILTAGNGMTSNPTITITDSSGSGATAVATESGGSLTGVTITNAGSLYTSNPTVTASGGVAAGVGGGGGSVGSNGGRLFGLTANGS